MAMQGMLSTSSPTQEAASSRASSSRDLEADSGVRDLGAQGASAEDLKQGPYGDQEADVFCVDTPFKGRTHFLSRFHQHLSGICDPHRVRTPGALFAQVFWGSHISTS